jgi:hypothetical protein
VIRGDTPSETVEEAAARASVNPETAALLDRAFKRDSD